MLTSAQVTSTRRQILARLGAASAALALHGCARPEPSMRVGSVVFPGYEFMYLAREMGLLEESRVRMIELLSDADNLRALAAGQLEAAALSLDELIQARIDGIDLRVVLIFDFRVAAPASSAVRVIPPGRSSKSTELAANQTPMVDVLAVRSEALAVHLETLKYLVASHFVALDFFRSQPERANILLAPRLQISPAAVPEMFQGIQMLSVAQNQTQMAQDGMFGNSVQGLVSNLASAQRLPALSDWRALVDSRFLPL